ncbi:MAG TPA: energy transducer TonB [Opitutaceae bacterium]|nr:energy transducer TonB [Opitutaceae bacterium]
MHAFPRSLTAVLLAALVYCPRLAAQDEMLSTPAEYLAIDVLDGSKPLPAQWKGPDQSKLPEGFHYDVPPRAAGKVVPVYPYSLLRKSKAGSAVVVCAIDQTGVVGETRVSEATFPELGEALAAALEAQTFTPAKRGGQDTMSLIAVEYIFSADDAAVRDDRALLERETKQPDTIAKANKLDAQPKPTATRQPAFPVALRGKAESGEAMIEFLIDEQGHVRLPRIVSATDPAFGDAAAQALTAWQFVAPKAGGQPAVVKVKIPVKFAAQANPTATPAKS